MTSKNKNVTEDNESNKNINPNNSWIKKVKKPVGYKEFYDVKKIFLLLDCSGSMATKNKFKQAKNGLLKFTYKALEKNYKIGLISFATKAKCLIEPIIDKNNVEQLSNSLDKLIAQGSTNMSNALKIALEKFDYNQTNISASKIICIITDGIPDNKEDVMNIAERVAKNKIDIITVGTDDADLQFLQKISTKKNFASITTPKQLEATITKISDLLPPG